MTAGIARLMPKVRSGLFSPRSGQSAIGPRADSPLRPQPTVGNYYLQLGGFHASSGEEQPVIARPDDHKQALADAFDASADEAVVVLS